MNIKEYLEWYYLIYLLPGGTAILLLLLSSIMGSMHGGGHAHGGHGGHGHMGHGSHGHAAHGNHGGAHGHATHGSHGHAQHASHSSNHSPSHTSNEHSSQGVKASALQNSTGHIGEFCMLFFGIGRVPSPVLSSGLLLGWSISGYSATRVLEPVLHLPSIFGLPAFCLATCGALVVSRIIAVVFIKWIPEDISQDISTVDLCGLKGTVAFNVDEVRGRIHVYDQFGTLHDQSARVAEGMSAIGKGKQVLVVDYDDVKDQLIVEPIP